MKNLPIFIMILITNLLFGQTKIAECIFNENKNVSKNCEILNAENQSFAITNNTLNIRFDDNEKGAIFKIKANHFENLELSVEFAENPNSFQIFVSSNKKSWKELEVNNRFSDLENYKYFYSFENNKKWIYLKIQSIESSVLLLKSIKVYGDYDKEHVIPLPD